MTDTYTPTTEEVREAVAEWCWSRRMFRPELEVSDGGELDRWLSEVRGAVLAEQGEPEWEYVPGWIGVLDGRARVSAGVIAPSYVAQYIAEGGEVVRRMVGRFEAVTADLLPVEENTEALTDGSER